MLRSCNFWSIQFGKVTSLGLKIKKKERKKPHCFWKALQDLARLDSLWWPPPALQVFTLISVFTPRWDRDQSRWGAATFELCFYSTNNCHITWAVSSSQRTAKITVLAHSKQRGWLIKRRWCSGKYQSDNISELGVSGCTVCSVAVCFQWLPCTCVCVWKHSLFTCAVYNVCVPVCVCVKGVSVFVASSSTVCVSMCWLAVGLLVAHAGWGFMISIFRLAWLSVWKPTYTQNKHTETHTHRKTPHGNTHRNSVCLD